MHIPLLAGEVCRETEGSPTVVVNRAFADAYFRGADVIGHHVQSLNLGYSGPAEIVGISGDARESSLDQPPVPTAYWCSSIASRVLFLVVPAMLHDHGRNYPPPASRHRTAGSAYDFAPLEQHFSDGIAENRLRTILLTFSLAPPLLPASASTARSAIPKRTSTRSRPSPRLGCVARPNRQTIPVAGTCRVHPRLRGWVCVSRSLLRVLAGLLYGVSPTDVPTLSAVILLVLVVAAAASLIPAIRASRVDPMQVLRDE